MNKSFLYGSIRAIAIQQLRIAVKLFPSLAGIKLKLPNGSEELTPKQMIGVMKYQHPYNSSLWDARDEDYEFLVFMAYASGELATRNTVWEKTNRGLKRFIYFAQMQKNILRLVAEKNGEIFSIEIGGEAMSLHELSEVLKCFSATDIDSADNLWVKNALRIVKAVQKKYEQLLAESI